MPLPVIVCAYVYQQHHHRGHHAVPVHAARNGEPICCLSLYAAMYASVCAYIHQSIITGAIMLFQSMQHSKVS
jgi:hypothetical protein